MAAHKPTAKEGGKKKTASKVDKPKKPTPAKQSKPAPAKPSKPMKKKTSKPSPAKKIHKGKVMKVRKGKSSYQLADEEEEVQLAPKPQVEDDEYNLQRGIQTSLESFQAPIDRVAIREPASGITHKLPVVEVIKDASTGPSAQPQDDTSANVVRDTLSPADAETGADTENTNSEADTKILNVGEEQGEDVSNTVVLEERIIELDEGQAGLEIGKTPESRPPPEHELMEEDQAGSNPGQSHVALVGPNREPMHEDFIASVYLKVHESLKHTTKEQVLIENPPSSTRTLSSMKNLEHNFTFGDQFINDKPTEEEPGKANVETEVESMVTVLIHQVSSSVHPLSTPVIDLSPPKPLSPPVQEPIITSTTKTTTATLPLPSPLQQQSTTDPKLVTHVSVLENICANFKKKPKLQDKTIQALSSRVYTLENHDLYSKIDKQVNKVVKEAVHDALQAPILDRFRDLSNVQMKEILHDRMFESGSYKSHPYHKALYKALEVSIDRGNREEFIKAKDKSLQTSSAKKTSNIREPPSSFSKQKPACQSEQSVDDVPIPEDVHLSDSEETGAAHLLKIKTRPEWADALAKMYKDPEENKLLWKTRDMGSFIQWYCKQIGKKKLVKADLEGPAYKIVLPIPQEQHTPSILDG
ncbi:hypothetical protein Tco_0957578 [Tanacetum coccineum]